MTEDYVPVGGPSAVDGSTSMRHCRSVDSLGEWRSCEQVDNGTPSTSPPYWDSDDEDDSGPKPCDLYGKFTWKIEHFSQLNKRELRSNAFEVGGYKWYILIYPQGCDACNHLSLFLCVANHDKLLPGWSHFALFTIAVVNKDPKKNKYNDTLHRFWKKEHDWGWKKFMELNKVVDGFVDDDVLTIKAQVQVIREKAHRPFRCLDIQYRRELIRVYVSAVEQTCARFVEEKKKKLQTLIDDKAQWSSFRSFWLGIDPNTRRLMSRDKTDVILKIVVKHFFIEKEVASTLVMDSLYTGLRVLESQSKRKKLRANLLEKEDLPVPFVFIENDMFVLADDVFLLLERAALESAHLPLPSKEEKGLPSRTKDGCSGDEFNRDSNLRDEGRLTELGRRTLEIFVFAHIFSSRIEIAYKEAVALKRQEELIREEETEQAEIEKREKRAKKKQARHRRNNRKGKDRGKDDISVGTMKEKHALQDSLSDDKILEDFSEHEQRDNEKSDVRREDVYDVSDPGDDGAEALQPDADDRDTSPLSWDTDTSETHPAAEACRSDISNCHVEKKSSSFVDDSSSTCSTDSVPSVVVNGPYKGYSSSNNKNKRNPSNRGKKQQNKDVWHNSTSNADRLLYVSGSCSASGPEPVGNLHSFMDQTQSLEPIKKEEVDMMLGTEVIVKDQVDEEIPSNSKSTTTGSVSSYANINRKPLPVKQSTETHTTATAKIGWVPTPEVTSNTPIESEKSVRLLVKSPQNLPNSKSEDLKLTSQAMTSTTNQASSMSRPSSAPVIPGPKPTVPLVSPSQTMPLLTRTLSSTTRVDSEPSFSAQTFEPQSYRNVIMGIRSGIRTATGASTSGFTTQFSSSSSTQSTAISQPSSSSSSLSSHPSQGAARKDQSSINHGIVFGSRRQDFLHNPHQRTDQFHSHVNDNTRISNNYESGISLRQSQGVMGDEFPHLDIINDLLDDDHRMVGMATFDGCHNHVDFHSMNQQYPFQGDLVTAGVDYLNASCQFDLPDYYYDELSQMVYDSFVPFHGISDMHPLPLDFSVYGNGTDALLQNQWPIDGADLSVLNFGNAMDVNGYPYQLPEYSTCGLGGYNMMYQPANGR